MKLGAVDVLTMPYNEQELLEATQHAIRRSRTRKQEGIATAEARTRIAKLSPRERDVLHLIAGGYRTPAIAEKLRLKPKTVESYRASIVAKTATSSIAELVRLALLADESQFRAGRNPHA